MLIVDRYYEEYSKKLKEISGIIISYIYNNTNEEFKNYLFNKENNDYNSAILITEKGIELELEAIIHHFDVLSDELILRLYVSPGMLISKPFELKISNKLDPQDTMTEVEVISGVFSIGSSYNINTFGDNVPEIETYYRSLHNKHKYLNMEEILLKVTPLIDRLFKDVKTLELAEPFKHYEIKKYNYSSDKYNLDDLYRLKSEVIRLNPELSSKNCKIKEYKPSNLWSHLY